MKINQLLGGIAVGFILASCQDTGKDIGQRSNASDAAGVSDKSALPSEYFKTVITLPYVADTALMFRMEKYDSLGTKAVRILDVNWSPRDSAAGEAYSMADFYKIDSVKASGNYAAWCDSLDIGMTKSSNAFALGKIVIDEAMQLFVWGLATSSYEACPYTTTRAVYISVVKGGVVIQTFKLAEYISSADPPVAMERITTGVIHKDLTIEMNMYEEGDEDMDLPEINVTKESYRFAIKEGKLSLVSEKKEAPVKVKRKKPVSSSE